MMLVVAAEGRGQHRRCVVTAQLFSQWISLEFKVG